MNERLIAAAFLLGAAAFMLSARVQAEPYLAVLQGYKCNVCHVNPTGGGLRNEFGTVYSKTLLPEATADGALNAWTGKLADRVQVGADLRADWIRSIAPRTMSQHAFSLEQFRVYANLTILPDRLAIYVDEQVAPTAAQNEEAYLRYGNTREGIYIKGGQFYLPFGWRLQDQSAFVREVSGINMATPDKGLELGYEHAAWSAQFDLTNGAGNAAGGSGYQATTQLLYTQPIWRLGVAGSFTQSHAGDRKIGGLLAGLKTGPVAWLAEADLVHDDSFPAGRRLAAGLLEGNWRLRTGHNLKLTAEYFDPDRALANDQQTRYSILYEYTPLPFLQLRAGFRRYRGIPQNNAENRQQLLIQLHGYF